MRHGQTVVRWGDTRQADMTFSVAKSYLALLAGLALGDGLIQDLDAPVSASVTDAAFTGPRNGAITWRMLLDQTSEWEGTLFGKADRIDRGRDLRREGSGPKGIDRPLATPASTGNTTTFASTPWLWPCCIASAGRCRTSSPSGS
ncbi:hypothetical protein ACFQU7_05325 [Pseudoroseomonas wenyumeiae]